MSGPNVFHAVTGVRTKTILDTIIKTLSHNLAAPAWLASSSGQGLTESVRTWAKVPRGQSPLPSLNVCHSHVILLFISSKLVSGAWTLTASTWHSTVTPLIFTAVLYGSCIIWIYISNLSTLCTAKLHCRSQDPQWQAQNNSWTTSSRPFSCSDAARMMNNSLIFHLPQSKNK